MVVKYPKNYSWLHSNLDIQMYLAKRTVKGVESVLYHSVVAILDFDWQNKTLTLILIYMYMYIGSSNFFEFMFSGTCILCHACNNSITYLNSIYKCIWPKGQWREPKVCSLWAIILYRFKGQWRELKVCSLWAITLYRFKGQWRELKVCSLWAWTCKG
jgi:hypothetical protein